MVVGQRPGLVELLEEPLELVETEAVGRGMAAARFLAYRSQQTCRLVVFLDHRTYVFFGGGD